MHRALLLLVGLLAGCRSLPRTLGDLPPPKEPAATWPSATSDELQTRKQLDDDRAAAGIRGPYIH